MADVLRFKAYVLRWFSNAHGITRKEARGIFKRYGVMEFIDEAYDALHCMSLDNVVIDIGSS